MSSSLKAYQAGGSFGYRQFELILDVPWASRLARQESDIERALHHGRKSVTDCRFGFHRRGRQENAMRQGRSGSRSSIRTGLALQLAFSPSLRFVGKVLPDAVFL
jgi:hypothetical protein